MLLEIGMIKYALFTHSEKSFFPRALRRSHMERKIIYFVPGFARISRISFSRFSGPQISTGTPNKFIL